ncbi:hypothetical protein Q3G72_018561 [Acer saccharum]|nr:hypothetical protein Q3G72_018561 [Acer saccharum]
MEIFIGSVVPTSRPGGFQFFEKPSGRGGSVGHPPADEKPSGRGWPAVGHPLTDEKFIGTSASSLAVFSFRRSHTSPIWVPFKLSAWTGMAAKFEVDPQLSRQTHIIEITKHVLRPSKLLQECQNDPVRPTETSLHQNIPQKSPSRFGGGRRRELDRWKPSVRWQSVGALVDGNFHRVEGADVKFSPPIRSKCKPRRSLPGPWFFKLENHRVEIGRRRAPDRREIFIG